MKIRPNQIELNPGLLQEVPVEQFLQSGFPGNESSSLIPGKAYLEPGQYTGSTHNFLLMLQLAFTDHKSIKITPDNIWLLICQGIANCVKEEETVVAGLKPRCGNKETISIRRDDFIAGQHNPWEEILPLFTSEINKRLGKELHQKFVLNFSTSTIKERSAFEITFMDTLSNFFNYEFISLCGIPEIELAGTREDYMRIRESVQYFRQSGLGWWLQEVEPIIEKFIDAFDGKTDEPFWNSVFKLNNDSGGPFVTGWIIKFFPIIKINLFEENGVLHEGKIPYIRKYVFLEYKEQQVKMYNAIARNPVFADPAYNNLTLDNFDTGVNTVPFLWKYPGEEISMNFIAGFIGILQQGHSLSAEINWIVKRS